ncbi:MAG: rRNA maturation RNase YbeY [Thermodesulfovibrionaceae bacterium]
MTLEVEVFNKQRKIKISLQKVKTVVKKILKLLIKYKDKKLLRIFKNRKHSLAVSIIFLSSKKMQEINFKYRSKRSTTDVLSFSYLTKNSDKVFLGEVLIDPRRVFFQSKIYGITFWQELKRVITHGILHLLNYDHEKSLFNARKMKIMENKILQALS